MERIRNTIAYCRALAIQKGHNLSSFELFRYGDTIIMSARCINEECWWLTWFDTFGPSGNNKDGSELNIIAPNSPLFTMKDCQALNHRPDDSEIENYRKADAYLKEKFSNLDISYFTGDLPEQSLIDLVKDSIENEVELLKFYYHYSPEQLEAREVRKTQIENWLLANFPLTVIR